MIQVIEHESMIFFIDYKDSLYMYTENMCIAKNKYSWGKWVTKINIPNHRVWL